MRNSSSSTWVTIGTAVVGIALVYWGGRSNQQQDTEAQKERERERERERAEKAERETKKAQEKAAEAERKLAERNLKLEEEIEKKIRQQDKEELKTAITLQSMYRRKKAKNKAQELRESRNTFVNKVDTFLNSQLTQIHKFTIDLLSNDKLLTPEMMISDINKESIRSLLDSQKQKASGEIKQYIRNLYFGQENLPKEESTIKELLCKFEDILIIAIDEIFKPNVIKFFAASISRYNNENSIDANRHNKSVNKAIAKVCKEAHKITEAERSMIKRTIEQGGNINLANQLSINKGQLDYIALYGLIEVLKNSAIRKNTKDILQTIKRSGAIVPALYKKIMYTRADEIRQTFLKEHRKDTDYHGADAFRDNISETSGAWSESTCSTYRNTSTSSVEFIAPINIEHDIFDDDLRKELNNIDSAFSLEIQQAIN